jgi:hypothetical protein
VLFEIAGVTEETAKEALRLAAHKLPIKCKYVKREGPVAGSTAAGAEAAEAAGLAGLAGAAEIAETAIAEAAETAGPAGGEGAAGEAAEAAAENAKITAPEPALDDIGGDANESQ